MMDKDIKTPYLQQRENGLTLTDGELSMCGDFRDLLPRLTINNLNHEILVRAAKIKNSAMAEDGRALRVLDATAGMGEDSFLLAAAGFEVSLYEKDEIIYQLLQDAVERAKEDTLSEIRTAAGRMEVYEGSSIEAMRNLEQRPDIIFLDPMFPKRQKKSLVKKKFQLLQQLEAPCEDAEELLAAAMALHPRKIIIKRPIKGEYLGGIKPSYSLKGGKVIRVDCIVIG